MGGIETRTVEYDLLHRIEYTDGQTQTIKNESRSDTTSSSLSDIRNGTDWVTYVQDREITYQFD